MGGDCGNNSCGGDNGGDDGGGDVGGDGGGDGGSQDEPNSKATSLRDGSRNSSRRHRLHNSPPVLSEVDKGAFHHSHPGHDHHAQGGGRLEHESIGDAIYTLNKKLKVNNIVLKGKNPICSPEETSTFSFRGNINFKSSFPTNCSQTNLGC